MPFNKTFTDQMGQKVTAPYPPKRIISLVPSQTELLFDLGLAENVVGITKFCVHPADKISSITKIGGTKTVDIQLIKSLEPDLIIANKEENEKEQIEELAKHFPVWISDIADLPGAIEMINAVGAITGKEKEALTMANQVQALFDSLIPEKQTRVAYFIWRKPFMLAGPGTFIDDMLQRCGFLNVTLYTRYPKITVEELIEHDPEVMFLSSEPYPFAQKHATELQNHLPNAKIYLVDGEMFSWYGSRLLRSVPYFKALINNIAT